MTTTRITQTILTAAIALVLIAAPGSAQPDERRGPTASDRDRDDQPDKRGFGDRRRFGDRAPELTDQRIEQMMTVINEHAPEYAAQLESLRERDPEAFRKLLRKLAPRFEAARQFHERDPEGFALHMRYKRLSAEIGRTVHRYRKTSDDSEKTELRDRLRELVDQRFALQIEQARREVVRIEQRLDTLRTEIAQREQNREQLVDEQLDKVLAASPDIDRGPFGPRDDPRNLRDPRTGPPPHHPDRPDPRDRPDHRDRRDGPPPPDAPQRP